MDREERLHVPKERVGMEERLDVGRDQSCLPIVAVDDVGLPAETPERFENAATKENESFVIILVILLRRWVLIDPVPAEIVRIVQKVDLDFFLQIADEGRLDVSDLGGWTDGNGNVLEPDDIVQLEPALADKAIPRHHDADLVTEFLDGFGERAGDVGETARLCERLDFA